MEEDVGFCILRCVRKPEHDRLWQKCYTSIRKYYSTAPILIVDDNSFTEHCSSVTLFNCKVIQSEFAGRGEILPYYYFWKYRIAKYCVCLHDSMFLQSKITLASLPIQFLWHFEEHCWDDPSRELQLIGKLKFSTQLSILYAAKKFWHGCFGGAAVLRSDFIDTCHNKYNLFALLDEIRVRHDRCSFERVIGTIAFAEGLEKEQASLFGCIHCFPGNFQVTFDDLEKNSQLYSSLPCLKCWSGR